jgi:acyl carrier protein
MSLHDEVKKFVSGLLQRKGTFVDLGDDTPLVSSGLLDSVDTIDIVTFLESRYGLDFGDIGFDEDRFESLATIVQLVEESGKSPSAQRD